ncbi:MAG: biotin/lipoate A/B protein ligase family protein [Candidatus Woesearchaeota archaeon]
MQRTEWRLINTPIETDGYMHMAIDESLMISVGNTDSSPVLRWYSWNHPSVSIGFFQSPKEELYYEKCVEDNIEIFRRMTGGGAVYKHPRGEINYSIIIRESPEYHDILSSYKKIAQPIIDYLNSIGVKAVFSGINDIIVEGKKISGNAQTRMHNAILQHGTILLDFDIEAMTRYLRISNEKITDKHISSIKDRVTWISRIMEIDSESLIKGINTEYERSMKIMLREDELSHNEMERAISLKNNKYGSSEWLWQR